MIVMLVRTYGKRLKVEETLTNHSSNLRVSEWASGSSVKNREKLIARECPHDYFLYFIIFTMKFLGIWY